MVTYSYISSSIITTMFEHKRMENNKLFHEHNTNTDLAHHLSHAWTFCNWQVILPRRVGK